jgi:ArsR family transcriptional regulator
MIDLLKALADSHRQNILKLLSRQEMGACEIIHAIGLSQPAVSHHLKILKRAKLIACEKEGKIVFYTLHKKGLMALTNKFGSFMEELSSYAGEKPKPSPLRQNPNLCTQLGFKQRLCGKEL